MSKTVPAYKLSLAEAAASVVALRSLLDGKAELSEREDIQPFFAAHPSLVALTGSLNTQLHRIDRLASEFDLFGNFRCDWVVGDSTSQTYTLVEFEDARRNSIFGGGTKYHEEWGRRFEHGFSQLVDWFWALDAYRGNPDLRKRFGAEPKQFFGLLIIGRDQFIEPDQRERLEWRTRAVPIGLNRIPCITFDQLYQFLDDRLRFVRQIIEQGDLG